MSSEASPNGGAGLPIPGPATRTDVLEVLDELMGRVNAAKMVFLRVSFSGIILAPLSVSLSFYLVLHPSFYRILDVEEGFGYVLVVFIGFLISVSAAWLAAGLRQHLAVMAWSKRCANYLTDKSRKEESLAAEPDETEKQARG
jgi:hypothetical protein